eukprot:Phypoly_transcript_08087.p1 GENE.Phypoly_transcript_08087~~Phypoly_transcript_08087.p1  ORF type:complete len:452 (+),score=62.39 Phypoly_transcript_08087:80-1357(+)
MAFLEKSIATPLIGVQSSVCSTHGLPLPKTVPVPTYLQQGEKCKAHKRKFHDIFLNYRVKCEGMQGKRSWEEHSGGVVEQVYRALATKKTKRGKPIYVFWDKTCLNDGQNWEMGFEQGIKNSQVIVLLMSNTTMQGILSNAAQHQDNVLIEYESALLLNKLYNKPVFPVFLAEYKEDSHELVPFSFSHSFPDVLHKRDQSSQLFIDSLSHSIPDIAKSFLGSIKQTMSEIFKLQGKFMPKRTEDENDLRELVSGILALLETSQPAYNHPLLSLLSSTQPPLSTKPPTPNQPAVTTTASKAILYGGRAVTLTPNPPNGPALVLAPLGVNDLNQQWILPTTPNGNISCVNPNYANYVWDVRGGKKDEGAKVILFPKTNNPNQQWHVSVDGVITSASAAGFSVAHNSSVFLYMTYITPADKATITATE